MPPDKHGDPPVARGNPQFGYVICLYSILT